MSSLQTRLESWQAIQPTLGKRQLEVYELLRSATRNGFDMTMREMLNALHWKDKCQITGRLKELRDLGLVVESCVRWDQVTRRNVTAWKAKNP